PYGVMPGRVCRHYLGSSTTQVEGTDRRMEPDREDRPAGPACLRESQPRETRLRDEWRRRSLATGWRMPDDWDSEAVGEVLAACQNRALARGEAGLAAVGATALAAACAGLGRSRAAEQRDTSPAETHRLLVVGLPRRPDPWRRLALPILVGRDLRAAFPGGETLSLAKPGPAIALVPARGDLPLRYARLRRNIQAAFGTQIRITPLPGQLTEALR